MFILDFFLLILIVGIIGSIAPAWRGLLVLIAYIGIFVIAAFLIYNYTHLLYSPKGLLLCIFGLGGLCGSGIAAWLTYVWRMENRFGKSYDNLYNRDRLPRLLRLAWKLGGE